MSFESELDELFNTSEEIEDTIWFSKTETLRDAIMMIYYENIAKDCNCDMCIDAGKQADEFIEKGELTL